MKNKVFDSSGGEDTSSCGYIQKHLSVNKVCFCLLTKNEMRKVKSIKKLIPQTVCGETGWETGGEPEDVFFGKLDGMAKIKESVIDRETDRV